MVNEKNVLIILPHLILLSVFFIGMGVYAFIFDNGIIKSKKRIKPTYYIEVDENGIQDTTFIYKKI